MRETQRLLRTFEAEQRDRHAHRARPLKFEGGRMPPAEEQKIKPVGYIAELGYATLLMFVLCFLSPVCSP